MQIIPSDKFYIFNCSMVNCKKENFIPIKYFEVFLVVVVDLI